MTALTEYDYSVSVSSVCLDWCPEDSTGPGMCISISSGCQAVYWITFSHSEIARTPAITAAKGDVGDSLQHLGGW